MGKPVLCLYDAGSGKALSAMIAGSDKVEMKIYRRVEEINMILDEYFK